MSTDIKDIAPADGADLGGIDHGKSGLRAVKNNVATIVIWAAFLIALIPLAWILWTVLSRGLSTMLDVTWWQKDQSGVGAPGFDHNVRGARHAIIGTLLIALGTSIIAIPIAVMTAIYLVEYGRGKLARVISFMVDILTGVPSVVAGLFVYALWVTTFGFDRVSFAVCLALTILMVPTIVRSTEEMLKLVPNELREASYALGVPKWKTIAKIVLPTAFSGIITGILLGLARVMGETAPLLLTVGMVTSVNWNMFDGRMATLPTFINQQYRAGSATCMSETVTNPITQEVYACSITTNIDRAWAAAFTLIVIVMVLNVIARLISHYFSPKLSR